jgi:hypothetical protein
MTDLWNQFNTVLAAGIGGISFLGVWAYMVLRWLDNTAFFTGEGSLLGWLFPWW